MLKTQKKLDVTTGRNFEEVLHTSSKNTSSPGTFSSLRIPKELYQSYHDEETAQANNDPQDNQELPGSGIGKGDSQTSG